MTHLIRHNKSFLFNLRTYSLESINTATFAIQSKYINIINNNVKAYFFMKFVKEINVFVDFNMTRIVNVFKIYF